MDVPSARCRLPARTSTVRASNRCSKMSPSSPATTSKPASGRQRQHLRHRARAHFRRRRDLRMLGGVSAGMPDTCRPAQSCPHFRRNPMRARPHRQHLRLPCIWRDARYRRHCEAHRRRAFLSALSSRKEEFASAISPGQHGTTFGGGPLACRVALEYLAIVEEENLLANVRKVGGYLNQQLQQLVEDYAVAKEVRGRGFIQGIELEVPLAPHRRARHGSGGSLQQYARHRRALSTAVPTAGAACRQGNPRATKVPGQKAPTRRLKNGEPKLPITEATEAISPT